MNHLALTLAVEEPFITTLSIRPGVVDTDMQALIRTKQGVMEEKDMIKFKGLFESGNLVKVEDVGGVMARIAVGCAGAEGRAREMNGRFMR
jgi:NAD(P)-dependent dehydrogenase (short-subunit alcohol dehydrogenase family)